MGYLFLKIETLTRFLKRLFFFIFIICFAGSGCENEADLNFVDIVTDCNTISTNEDTSHLTLLGSQEFGPGGGVLELVQKHSEVRWFKIDIPAGALPCKATIEVYYSTKMENAPLGFSQISPIVEIKPTGLTFNSDFSVLLPYNDADQDGIVDDTVFPETEIYPSYYSSDSKAWGPLEAMVPDTVSNIAGLKANRLSPFTLWGATDGTDVSFPGTEASIYMIANDWAENPSYTEASVISKMYSNKLGNLFIHIYEPSATVVAQGVVKNKADGKTLPAGVTAADGYFSLNTLISEAQAQSIKIIPVVTCFSYGQPNEQNHKDHLLNVIDFFVSNYPDIDGIMLDFVRFNEEVRSVTPSFQNATLVTNFIKEVKDNHSNGLPVYLSVWPHASTYRELLLGQRLADLSFVSDYLCAMLYSGTQTESYDTKERIISDFRKTALTRNSLNNTKTMIILSTYGEITPTSLDQHLSGSLEAGSNGIGFFRFGTTDDNEWNTISSKLL